MITFAATASNLLLNMSKNSLLNARGCSLDANQSLLDASNTNNPETLLPMTALLMVSGVLGVIMFATDWICSSNNCNNGGDGNDNDSDSDSGCDSEPVSGSSDDSNDDGSDGDYYLCECDIDNDGLLPLLRRSDRLRQKAQLREIERQCRQQMLKSQQRRRRRCR